MPLWQVLAIGALILIGGAAIGAAAGGTTGKTKTVAGPTVTATSTLVVAAPTITTTPTKVIATHVVTHTEVYTPPPVDQFSDGTYRVGPDIPAGIYKTDGQSDSGSCYYAVLNSLDRTDIAENDNIDGPTSVQVSSGKAFEVSGGCSWSKIG